MSSSSSLPCLLGLPAEVLLLIGSHLPSRDKFAFASINLSVREVLTPVLFQTLRFWNDDADEDEIEQLITKYGRHVQCLHFTCKLYPNEEKGSRTQAANDADAKADGEGENGDDAEDEDNLKAEVADRGIKNLPTFACKLLAGETITRAQSIVIEFVGEGDFACEGDWAAGAEGSLGSIYIASEDEDDEQVETAENAYNWREVLSKVWAELAKNASIESVQIIDLLPRQATSWQTQGWKHFLSQLKELSIGIWGAENGAGWHSNTCEGYVGFLGRLDTFFFDHTKSLTHLEIAASELAPYGCHGGGLDRHAPLGLRSDQMPGLKVLELEHCIIDPDLINFLTSLSKSLERLTLTECMSCAFDSMTDDEVTWASLFGAIASSEPALQTLVVQNGRIPLTGDEHHPRKGKLCEDGRYEPPADEDQDVRSIREALSRGEGRLFRHAELDDKYGMVFACPEDNVRRYQEGDDGREYQHLLTIVERNARAVARENTGEGVKAVEVTAWKLDRLPRPKHEEK